MYNYMRNVYIQASPSQEMPGNNRSHAQEFLLRKQFERAVMYTKGISILISSA